MLSLVECTADPSRCHVTIVPHVITTQLAWRYNHGFGGIALTCYISLSAKQKNNRLRHIREPKPSNRLWWNLAWLITSGTPPHMTTLVGVAQCGWSGQICDVSISEFLFFLFCLLRHAPRTYFFASRDDLYAKTPVSGQGCAFWGFRQYPTTFRG